MRRLVFTDVEVVNCHAFTPDERLLAICPNSEDIMIFRLQGDEFQRTHILSKHTQRVTGLAWSSNDRLASCAEDRTAFVWEWDAAGSAWRSVIVELRAPRAALCLAWAPNGARFAVGLSSRDMGICYYEEQANCWVALKVGKHKAAVTALAWHPTSKFIATGSTDRHCMVYDVSENLMTPLVSGFGKTEVSEDAGSWVNAVAFSPKGQFLAFFGQDATARVKDLTGGPSAASTVIRWRGLPFLRAIFPSEKCLIACGFDCAPVVFRRNDTQWEVHGQLTLGPSVGTPLAEKTATAFSEARNAFRGSLSGPAGGATSGSGGTPKAATASSIWHTNTITACNLVNLHQCRFSTSALDGQVLVCELAA